CRLEPWRLLSRSASPGSQGYQSKQGPGLTCRQYSCRKRPSGRYRRLANGRDSMIQLRPSQADLQRLKEPFGRLLSGNAAKTMAELNLIIGQTQPGRVATVGDVVSRETLATGIKVDLRILDHISMRRPTEA